MKEENEKENKSLYRGQSMQVEASGNDQEDRHRKSGEAREEDGSREGTAAIEPPTPQGNR